MSSDELINVIEGERNGLNETYLYPTIWEALSHLQSWRADIYRRYLARPDRIKLGYEYKKYYCIMELPENDR